MEPLARRPHGGARHRRPLRSPRERDQRNEQADERGDGHASRHSDDPFGVRAREDVHEAGRAPEGVPERRRAVVVECREGARHETGEEMCDPGWNDPAQRLGAGVTRDLRPVPGQHVRQGVGREQRDGEERHADDGKRDTVSRRHAREPPFVARACKRREHRDANGL